MQGMNGVAIGRELSSVEQSVGCLEQILVMRINHHTGAGRIDIVVNAVAEQCGTQSHMLQIKIGTQISLQAELRLQLTVTALIAHGTLMHAV